MANSPQLKARGEVTVGDYFADIVVENTVIVEVKSIKSLAQEHEAQLLNYLRATEIEVSSAGSGFQVVKLPSKCQVPGQASKLLSYQASAGSGFQVVKLRKSGTLPNFWGRHREWLPDSELKT